MSATTTRPRNRLHTAAQGTVLPWRSLASLGIDPGFGGLLDFGETEGQPSMNAAAAQAAPAGADFGDGGDGDGSGRDPRED
ncbi:hypothetical protein [Streptomyces yaizuensis]|uniref:Uncharacterized protein n=1 Tax=Streptomyces yaizuensis TaxID=2989713 RepID=A0ABQ5NZ20_9ACTN|nr:hypothetical protein [Streptomyces sp. YSPA8]GLF95611.1 hypothetical protein SYYSPA8_14960 [Streptomyces sp. YSPA8]